MMPDNFLASDLSFSTNATIRYSWLRTSKWFPQYDAHRQTSSNDYRHCADGGSVLTFAAFGNLGCGR
jgi:hypothetical protein